MNPTLLNSLCYTTGWFLCVFSGIRGYPILGVITATMLIVFQLYHIRQRSTELYIQDLLLAIFSIPLGILLEIFFIQSGLIIYTNSTSILPPVWIISLYPLFSLLINHSLRVFKKSYLFAFLFGFSGAPLSYIAGQSLGGLIFPNPIVPTWIILGSGWGIFLCLIVKVANIIEKATAETLADRDSKQAVELLYDGDCPLCDREICMLRSKNLKNRVKFIDISSNQYLPEEHNNVDFDTAMMQMHAVDSAGKLLTGLPAFAAVYARCDLLLASTLLRIPFMKVFLNPVYRLFAKNRLWITGRTMIRDKD